MLSSSNCSRRSARHRRVETYLCILGLSKPGVVASVALLSSVAASAWVSVEFWTHHGASTKFSAANCRMDSYMTKRSWPLTGSIMRRLLSCSAWIKSMVGRIIPVFNVDDRLGGFVKPPRNALHWASPYCSHGSNNCRTIQWLH